MLNIIQYWSNTKQSLLVLIWIIQNIKDHILVITKFDNRFSLPSTVSLVPNVVNLLSVAGAGRLCEILATYRPFQLMRLFDLHRIFHAFSCFLFLFSRDYFLYTVRHGQTGFPPFGDFVRVCFMFAFNVYSDIFALKKIHQ